MQSTLDITEEKNECVIRQSWVILPVLRTQGPRGKTYKVKILGAQSQKSSIYVIRLPDGENRWNEWEKNNRYNRR